MWHNGADTVHENLVDVAGAGPVRVRLRGRAPLLLMINGIGGHIDMWEPAADKLARTRRLVLFDAPGAGMSPALAKPMRMSGLSVWVVQLLDQLNIGQVDVLGYSWGGALAQQLAHDYPQRVRRLILVATVPGVGGRPPKLRVAKAMFNRDRYRVTDRSEELAATLYGGDDAATGGAESTGIPISWHAHPPSRRGYGHQLFAISGWSSLPWLRRLTHSTLIICGDDDPLVPRVNARIMARLIPRSELHLIPGGGHLWLLQNPTQGAALIEQFLAGAEAPHCTSTATSRTTSSRGGQRWYRRFTRGKSRAASAPPELRGSGHLSSASMVTPTAATRWDRAKNWWTRARKG